MCLCRLRGHRGYIRMNAEFNRDNSATMLKLTKRVEKLEDLLARTLRHARFSFPRGLAHDIREALKEINHD